MRKSYLFGALAVAAVAIAAISCTEQKQEPQGLVIEKQGVFSSGGRVTEAIPGEYDPTQNWLDQERKGTTTHVDHANTMYQIPAGGSGTPMVFLHGYGQTRTGWQSTPDGREGWSDLFLKKGYSVFLVDQPRRGAAGATEQIVNDPGDVANGKFKVGEQAWYTHFLERMQNGDGDITEWLVWYMQKLVDALDEADTIVTTILNKSFFWQKASSVPMTERQTQMLNLFLDGYKAKITSKTWATLAKCSKDTAIRDIQDLVGKNILIEDIPGAKRPSYSIVYDAEDLTQFFTEVSITEENGIPYLKAIFKGKKPVCERILKLDAVRYQKGELPLSNLLSKYCSYIVASN